MALKMIMPQAGITMEEGTIIRWLKQEGDTVVKDEVILEIETDKTNMEIESTVNGTVLKILVQEGETVPVMAPIAIIGDTGEDISNLL